MAKDGLMAILTHAAFRSCQENAYGLSSQISDSHELYASQATKEADQRLADIWSAGVVALQLLLPTGLPQRGLGAHYVWVHRIENTARSMGRKSATEATAFVQKVLMYDFGNRPTATEVLEDPWIVRHRGEEVVNNFHFNFPTPVVSRHASSDPSNAFSKQGSVGPSDGSAQGSVASEFRHASAGPSRPYNTQSPSITRESVEYEYIQGVQDDDLNKGSSSRGSLNDLSRQSSIDPDIIAALQSRPDYGDDWNDFDSVSEHGTLASRRSHGTATPLASKVSSAMEDKHKSSRQSSIDADIIAALQSRPDYEDDWDDFDSVDWNDFDRMNEHGTSASRRSHDTATPLAPKIRSAMEDNLGGKTSQQSGKGSRHSHSRSSRGSCSEQGSMTTQSSRFTANPLAREPRLRTPTPTANADIPGLSPRSGSIRSPPRSRAARSPTPSPFTEYDPQESSDETITPRPSRSQSYSEEGQAVEEEDDTTSAVGPVEGHGETEVSEDHNEEMETDQDAAVVPSPAVRTPLRAKNGRFLKVRKGKGKGKGGRVEK